MNWVKGFALVTCLATPLSVIVATSASADPAATTTPAAPAAPAPAGGMMMKKSGMTDAEKAKSADCSKQADAKKLHGEERKKFRQACKKS